MITTILKKSITINYALVGIMAVVLFFIYQINIPVQSQSADNNNVIQKISVLLFFLAAVFLLDFITKKNDFSKDNSFTFFFYLFFILFFPSILNDLNLLVANFFVLLSIRRLISMSNPTAVKQKIFDASLWIFVASLFHFWCILFLILVFIAIIIDASRDYRNWLVPFIGFLAVGIIFIFFAFVCNKLLINNFLTDISTDYSIVYFTNIYQNIIFSIFITLSIYFFASFLLSFSNNPMVNSSAYKKLFLWFLISFGVYFISNHKSNAVLLFTIAPLSIIATNHIENLKLNWQKELIFITIVAFGLFGFFIQL
jgi:hypothetical protein